MLAKTGRLRRLCSAYERFKGYKNVALDNVHMTGVTIVKTKEHANKVIRILESLSDR